MFFFGDGGAATVDGGSFSFLMGTKYCCATDLAKAVCLGDWTGEMPGDWIAGTGRERDGTTGGGGKGEDALGSQDGGGEPAAVRLAA